MKGEGSESFLFTKKKRPKKKEQPFLFPSWEKGRSDSHVGFIVLLLLYRMRQGSKSGDDWRGLCLATFCYYRVCLGAGLCTWGIFKKFLSGVFSVFGSFFLWDENGLEATAFTIVNWLEVKNYKLSVSFHYQRGFTSTSFVLLCVLLIQLFTFSREFHLYSQEMSVTRHKLWPFVLIWFLGGAISGHFNLAEKSFRKQRRRKKKTLEKR